MLFLSHVGFDSPNDQLGNLLNEKNRRIFVPCHHGWIWFNSWWYILFIMSVVYIRRLDNKSILNWTEYWTDILHCYNLQKFFLILSGATMSACGNFVKTFFVNDNNSSDKRINPSWTGLARCVMYFNKKNLSVTDGPILKKFLRNWISFFVFIISILRIQSIYSDQ